MNNTWLLENSKNRSTINVSLTLNFEVYSELKGCVSRGKLSLLANTLFENYLKQERAKKMVESYQRIARSAARKDVYDETEGAIEDGIK